MILLYIDSSSAVIDTCSALNLLQKECDEYNPFLNLFSKVMRDDLFSMVLPVLTHIMLYDTLATLRRINSKL